ncbi:GntR family transcriptional regulator [Propionivibrio dicarboxylicus]|uniref:Transcriptional regulator, GntR family n=1 Tax=Propionivibrio dicarboxylicus TaxID=83767 RepID=A0A1G8ALK6_9RHOO|nr:GntR family transcriptional regulator [Propionivibrio dicarboxylicus]SDH21912.1 transcriptional regulator, GntR family [Propionivibrio dicarboxylicus]
MDCKRQCDSVAGRIADAIEENIITGVFHPGARLDEISLAKDFGVSRTPIREALLKLDALGMIRLTPRRGASVTVTPPDMVYEMFEVMAGLESMCARLAARRHNDGDRARIAAALEECAAARDSADSESYSRANENFHQAVYLASHNRVLIEHTRSLSRRLTPYRKILLKMRGHLQKSVDGHCLIADALCAGEGDLAAERIRQHVLLQGETFSDWLASLSGMAE